MSVLIPPEPPTFVAVHDDDRHRRFRYRHWLLLWTVLTILVTGWLVSLGPVPAILGLAVAKHILVALAMLGLGVDQRRDLEV